MIHPAVRDLFQSLSRQPAFQELAHAFAAGPGPEHAISLSGLTTTAKALYIVLLRQATERPVLLLVDGNKQAEAYEELIGTFYEILISSRASEAPQLIPALDVLPAQKLSPHSEVSEQRAIGLWRIATRGVPIAITPVGSALLRTYNAEFYRQLPLLLRTGDELPLDDILSHLHSIGYERREPVEMVGEYSLRGGILDVFPAQAEKPVRIEFFGDSIESMRRFDVESQRSVVKVQDCLLLPLLEEPRSRDLLKEIAARLPEGAAVVPGETFPGWEFAAPLVRARTSSILSLMDNPIVIWDEPEQIRGAAERLWTRLEERDQEVYASSTAIYYKFSDFESEARNKSQVHLRQLELGGSGLHIPSRPSLAFRGNLPVAVAETRSLVETGQRVVFFASSMGELERLADIFQEYSVPFQVGMEQSGSTPEYLAERAYMAGSLASTFLVRGHVPRGTILPDSGLAIFGSEDLFETSDLVVRPGGLRSHAAAFSTDSMDLSPGDYVVHAEHGVGRFAGIREIEHGDQKGDFMLLEYAGETKLYVPMTRMDLIQKFRGAGESAPTLDRLGGATWNRTKSRVKAKIRDMADELLKLYAERKMAEGFSFSPDSNWQRELEDAFEFSETKDQVTAIRDIKRDMESAHPMDRLLCGDVGFGKTEVAMRAAFKALGDGKQVAVLAPTTVLAFQHHETFKRRFASFPVRVELLSRFRAPKEIAEVIGDVANGKVDVVIGTHRILSKDVEFRDLGLLVVDEEQRFGVRHKERLKQLKKNVDVLTMTATPIPRTLHMSLLGMRDMSVIETPPKDRLAIQTVVAHYHPELIKTAIEQELGRGGQIYFIHNRVDTIWSRAASIQELVPHCRIGVGHGQMGEAELEKVMLGFMRHEYDLFVSTTIVENGLDIPLANTIIIENAERYGLAAMYQLRGRVGRSNRRAYAYLLVPPDSELSEVARKRLAALKEFSDLGAGFKIAALDLELRGAGNLLGGEQHGHINSVGFDMYVRLLEETAREMKGEEVPLEIHSSLNLGLDLRIPPGYIADEHQRLRAYKKIADITDAGHAAKVLAEMEDRYGPVPGQVKSLAEFALVKSTAQRLGIESIERRQGMLNIKFHKDSRVQAAALMNLVRKTAGAQFTPAGVLRIPVTSSGEPSQLLGFVGAQLLQLDAQESSLRS